MEQTALNFSERQARRDAMNACLDAANRRVEDWGDLALEFLRNYAAKNQFVFAEDVTQAAESWGLVAPKDDRSWGAIYPQAIREKIITKDKSIPARERKNGNLALVYRSLVWVGNAVVIGRPSANAEQTTPAGGRSNQPQS